jgi:hypothetical protein
VRDHVPVTHVPLDELNRRLAEIRRSPADDGRLELIVRRPEVETREVLAEAQLTASQGLLGDCWRTRGSSSTPDKSANPDAEITIMNARSVAAIAGDRARWALAGDQLYADLDLSLENLPPGSQLQVGTAVLEVTALPHRGCGKFLKRFGKDAVKFVNSAEGRALNLRGVNARIVESGVVRVGDAIRKAGVSATS